LAPACLATLLLVGCGASDLDDQQAAQEQRTCASLRERVAARALADAGIRTVPDGEPVKADGLSPLVLLDDPDTWYETLSRSLDDADEGRDHGPSPLSPASRLVDRCRRLEP
jgi:hypothetical protein